ncbi:MAG TPA: M56 family metallopeptidase [Gemmataceae bacterium]|nr:M56 family metallopeptidase [Gemmataceae bacterium]
MDLGGPAFGSWLARSAAGGGAILLLSLLVMRCCRQPARQQRVGELGLAAAFLLALLGMAPAWWSLPVLPAEPGFEPRTASSGYSAALDAQADAESHDLAPLAALLPAPSEREGMAAEPQKLSGPQRFDVQQRANSAAVAAAQSSQASAGTILPDNLLGGLNALYLAIAAILLGRWLLGHLALRRLLRQSKPASERVAALFQQMSQGLRPSPRLLVSDRLRVAISCGLRRPTVVVPESLCKAGQATNVRWVFAHELTHLERRDAWACALFAVCQVVYFYVPWLWLLRRRIRLCQEYIADAAAAGADANAEDYADFLLGLMPPAAIPRGATGVSGSSSDLFRRITMLLQSPRSLEKRCPRRWTLAAASGLLVLAVIASGVRLQASAAPAREETTPSAGPVPGQEKENPLRKKDEPAKKDALPDLQAGNNGSPMRDFMQMREEMMKRMPPMQGQAGMMGMMGFGGHSGRLGVIVQTPDETLVEQLELPKDKGLVVVRVQPESAAAKAGIKAHDIVLEFNGKNVDNQPAKFSSMIHELKAGTAMDAIVLRKGKKETIKGITLPEAKGFAGMGGMPGMGMPGMPGMQGAPMLGMQGLPPLQKSAPARPGFAIEGQMQPPAMQAPPMFGLGQGQGIGLNGQSVITTNFRTGDRFTTRHEEGSLIITVTGAIDDGRAKVSEIKVQEGGQASKYATVDKVPQEYRDKVKNLVELNQKSNARIELKTNPGEKKP